MLDGLFCWRDLRSNGMNCGVDNGVNCDGWRREVAEETREEKDGGEF